MFDSSYPAGTRPAPVQRRGLQRRDAILDAAQDLLIEGGYEAATLKAISERTAIPLPSVYHYFKDRGQVDLEVAQRHAEQLTASVATAMEPVETNADLHDIISAVVAAYVDYYRRHPGFVQLWLARRNAVLNDVAEAHDAAQIDLLWRLLVDNGLIGDDTHRLVVRLAYEAGSRLLDMAFRDDRNGDEETIRETVRLLVAYLDSHGSARRQ